MRILVPLDGSHFSEHIISAAAKLANEAQAEVVLVQVVDPSEIHGTSTGGESMLEVTREEFTEWGQRITDVDPRLSDPKVLEFSDQAAERVVQSARDYLHHMAGQFAPIQPESEVLVGHDVDEELLNLATAQDVDLIAMSTHGRTGLARTVLGSHAEKIMRSGVAPVLLVRPGNLHQ